MHVRIITIRVSWVKIQNTCTRRKYLTVLLLFTYKEMANTELTRFELTNFVVVFLKRVKHSKIADGIESALESKKYFAAGMESDQVINLSAVCPLTNVPPIDPFNNGMIHGKVLWK